MKSLQLAKPHLLLLVGIPGSGKSTFAEKFATTFGAPCISFDMLRSLSADAPSARRIMNHQLEQLIKTQQTVIIDGATDTRAERQELTKRAREAGYEPLLIWVQTDPATARARAQKTTKASPGMLADDYDAAFRRFSPPKASEKAVVISGKHTQATQIKVVLMKLSESRSTRTVAPATPLQDGRPARRNITIR